MRRGLLLMLLAAGVVLAGCGGGAKTTSTASEAETSSNAAQASTACLELDEAVLAWVKQAGNAFEALGRSGEGAALTRSDEESYRVEAAIKKVTAAVPSAAEAATRFVSTIDTVRTALSEGDAQHAAGALAEVKASSGPLIATCHG